MATEGSNTVSVVFHSKKGHTGAIARAIARGAESVEGVKVLLIPVDEVDQRWDDLQRSDAIVFGCPTFMGSASAGMKEFMEKTFYNHIWGKQQWKDKIAGGFTNSASQSGDKMTTLFQLSVFAAQLCMVWVGIDTPPGNNYSKGSPDDLNRLGASLGMMSQSDADLPAEQSPRQSDQKTAELYGRRIAETALHCRWVRKMETKHLNAY